MRSRSRKQNYLRKNIYQTNKIIFGIKKAYTDKKSVYAFLLCNDRTDCTYF